MHIDEVAFAPETNPGNHLCKRIYAEVDGFAWDSTINLEGEIALESYETLKKPGVFSEELLNKILRGISAREYRDTLMETAGAFGVSPGTVSRHVVEVTVQRLRDFKERALSDIVPFSVFIDTIHRGGEVFLVALGIDTEGHKHVLGFWEGATENHALCEELFSDIERRGLWFSKRILWVTDGGKGILKALRDRFGEKLIHQRCTIHKDRNIQSHLAKKYREKAHRRFKIALGQNSCEDAKRMLLEFEKWLRGINESAADSLMEAFEDILTLHRLKGPGLLRKTLTCTNPIESMFLTARDCEGNIKRCRNSTMSQRWLAAVLLHWEKGFRRAKGYLGIAEVIATIEQIQEEKYVLQSGIGPFETVCLTGPQIISTKNLTSFRDEVIQIISEWIQGCSSVMETDRLLIEGDVPCAPVFKYRPANE